MAPLARLDVIASHLSAQPIVLLQKIDGRIAIVTMNRPNKFNALNRETISELTRILGILDRDPTVYVIILTGKGKAFSFGTDMKRYTEPLALEMQSGGWFEEFCERLRLLHKPLFAAVNGFCYGDGFELALQCDMIFASDYAKFRLNAIHAGVVSSSHAVQSLLKSIGKQQTMMLALTGRRISAAEAANFGICRLEKGNPVTNAVEYARKLYISPLPLLIAAKTAIRQAFETGLAAGAEAESGLQRSTFGVDREEQTVTQPTKKRR